jgi:hypothetical protein
MSSIHFAQIILNAEIAECAEKFKEERDKFLINDSICPYTLSRAPRPLPLRFFRVSPRTQISLTYLSTHYDNFPKSVAVSAKGLDNGSFASAMTNRYSRLLLQNKYFLCIS